jgi:hypothetical protein
MFIEVPEHHAVNLSIMMASIGYQMISEKQEVPTELHQLAAVFNQILEDDAGTKGDFFETIAQKFPDVAPIIRNDTMVQASSSYKAWV